MSPWAPPSHGGLGEWSWGSTQADGQEMRSRKGTLEGALGQQGEVLPGCEGTRVWDAMGRWRVRREVGPALALSPPPTSSFLEHTGFFKTLDTDLDGVVTFDLFKVGLFSGWVGEGAQGQWVFLTHPLPRGGGLQPAASESALRLATCILQGHSKDLWFLRVGAGRPRPLEACTGASSLGPQGWRR